MTLTGCLISVSALLSAQPTLPVPRNIQRAYDKNTRDISGKPGIKYWQNFAAYDLNVHFDLEYSFTLNKGSHILTGQIDEGAWFIACFFPHIAVRDDLNRFNFFSYLGT